MMGPDKKINIRASWLGTGLVLLISAFETLKWTGLISNADQKQLQEIWIGRSISLDAIQSSNHAVPQSSSIVDVNYI